MRQNIFDKKFDTKLGLIVAISFVSVFLDLMIGTIMIRFCIRPDIVPTGPMGTIEDPASFYMGLILIICVLFFISGIIFSKKILGLSLIIAGGFISTIPLVWGWYNTTSIYLDRSLVIMGLCAGVFVIIFSIIYIFIRKR